MTLIDKAEALLTCPFCGEDAYNDKPTWRVFGKRTGHEYAIACSNCEAVAPGDDDPALAIAAWNRRAALPARGVGVPADVKEYAIDVSEAYDTMMEVQRNPAGAWQVIQALAGHIAALAPTDAAQAREATFRDGWGFAYRQWQATGSVPDPDYRPSTETRT